MKIILTPLLLDLLRSSISPAFVLGQVNDANVHAPLSTTTSYQHIRGTKSSKASAKSMKTPPYCPRLSCGGTFTDKVTLSENLFCQVDADDNAEEAQGCAITLDGPEAIIDCRGFAVHQAAPAGDSAVNCPVDADADFAVLKQECGLDYARGICLFNGAKATNCNVERFVEGIAAFNGGGVQNSDVSFNRDGITAFTNTTASTSISKTKAHNNGSNGMLATIFDVGDGHITVTNSEFYNNGYGQNVNDKSDVGNGIAIGFVGEGKCNVDFDGVTSNSNAAEGIAIGCIKGGEIRANDAVTYNNDGGGFAVESGGGKTTVDLEGTITSSHNGEGGIGILDLSLSDDDVVTVVNVKGDVNIYSNGRIEDEDNGGLFVFAGSSTTFDIVVEEGGSFNSCGNEEFDIYSKGSGTWEGEFTCDPAKLGGSGDKPACVPCPSCSST